MGLTLSSLPSSGMDPSFTERASVMPIQAVPLSLLRLLALLSALGCAAGGVGGPSPALAGDAPAPKVVAGQTNATVKGEGWMSLEPGSRPAPKVVAGQTNATVKGEGWVSLEPGSRPAYVGIQGGTAPVTLFRSPEGELFTYTGNTGSDFMHILRGNGSLASVAPLAGNGERLAAVPAPGAVGSGLSGEQALDAVTTGPAEALQPFGLSTPEGVIVDGRADEPEAPAPLPEPPKPPRQYKALKLGSYLKILAQDSP
jgi:hypothetical protein